MGHTICKMREEHLRKQLATAKSEGIAIGRKEERAAIVAWLRTRRASFGKPTRNAQAALNIQADRIEHGDHLPRSEGGQE